MKKKIFIKTSLLFFPLSLMAGGKNGQKNKDNSSDTSSLFGISKNIRDESSSYSPPSSQMGKRQKLRDYVSISRAAKRQKKYENDSSSQQSESSSQQEKESKNSSSKQYSSKSYEEESYEEESYKEEQYMDLKSKQKQEKIDQKKREIKEKRKQKSIEKKADIKYLDEQLDLIGQIKAQITMDRNCDKLIKQYISNKTSETNKLKPHYKQGQKSIINKNFNKILFNRILFFEDEENFHFTVDAQEACDTLVVLLTDFIQNHCKEKMDKIENFFDENSEKILKFLEKKNLEKDIIMKNIEQEQDINPLINESIWTTNTVEDIKTIEDIKKIKKELYAKIDDIKNIIFDFMTNKFLQNVFEDLDVTKISAKIFPYNDYYKHDLKTPETSFLCYDNIYGFYEKIIQQKHQWTINLIKNAQDTIINYKKNVFEGESIDKEKIENKMKDLVTKISYFYYKFDETKKISSFDYEDEKRIDIKFTKELFLDIKNIAFFQELSCLSLGISYADEKRNFKLIVNHPLFTRLFINLAGYKNFFRTPDSKTSGKPGDEIFFKIIPIKDSIKKFIENEIVVKDERDLENEYKKKNKNIQNDRPYHKGRIEKITKDYEIIKQNQEKKYLFYKRPLQLFNEDKAEEGQGNGSFHGSQQELVNSILAFYSFAFSSSSSIINELNFSSSQKNKELNYLSEPNCKNFLKQYIVNIKENMQIESRKIDNDLIERRLRFFALFDPFFYYLVEDFKKYDFNAIRKKIQDTRKEKYTLEDLLEENDEESIKSDMEKKIEDIFMKKPQKKTTESQNISRKNDSFAQEAPKIKEKENSSDEESDEEKEKKLVGEKRSENLRYFIGRKIEGCKSSEQLSFLEKIYDNPWEDNSGKSDDVKVNFLSQKESQKLLYNECDNIDVQNPQRKVIEQNKRGSQEVKQQKESEKEQSVENKNFSPEDFSVESMKQKIQDREKEEEIQRMYGNYMARIIEKRVDEEIKKEEEKEEI